MNSMIDILRSLQTTPSQVSGMYLFWGRSPSGPAILSKQCTEEEKPELFTYSHYYEDKSRIAKRIFSQI